MGCPPRSGLRPAGTERTRVPRQPIRGLLDKGMAVWRRRPETDSSSRYFSTTKSLCQCSHPRIRTNHSHSNRSQQPAGCTWGTATSADEIDRNQHLARERDSVRHKLRDRRGREGLAPEQLKIDQSSISFADCHLKKVARRTIERSRDQQTDAFSNMIRSMQKQH